MKSIPYLRFGSTFLFRNPLYHFVEYGQGSGGEQNKPKGREVSGIRTEITAIISL